MLNRLLSQEHLADDAVAIAYAWRGEAEHWLGDYAKAIYDLNEALRRDPQNDWACVLRGITNRNLYAYGNASRDLAKAVALNPRGLYGLTESAKLRFQVFGDFAGARVKLNDALELDPRYGWAYVIRGDLRRLTGDFAGSIADFDLAISTEMRYQHYYWALIRRASSYRRLGLTGEAMSDLMLARERYPRDDWVHYEISLTCALDRKTAEVDAELDIAIAMGGGMLAEDPEDYFQRMKMVVYETVRFNTVPDDLSIDQLPTHHCFELYHELEDVVFVFPANVAAKNLMSALRAHLP
jgi:tetratricopeptide (TPR) repeat protein